MPERVIETILAAIMLMSGSLACATPLPARGVFVYSNLCTEPESGDTAGHRIVLVQLDGDMIVNYEWGGEGPLEGATAVTSRLDNRSGALQFEIRTDDGKTQAIRGTISTQAFLLIQGIDWESAMMPLSIPRQRDLTTGIPTCKTAPRRK